jgi:hypothetical protein
VTDWQEATEREVAARTTLGAAPLQVPVRFDADRDARDARDTIDGSVTLSITALGDGVHRLRIAIANTTPLDGLTHDDAIARAFVSTHACIGVEGGELVSLLDPPEALRAAAEGCRNIGVWPVLIGRDGDRRAMIASPVILYDYPRVAPESPGDLFDGTEIDEILTQRILTPTDDEKRAMRAVDPRAAALLDRTEALGVEDRMRLHGAMRSLGRAPSTSRGLGPGDRVRLHPRARADVMDIALRGKAATIASIEQDYEGRVFFAVTVDDDPGRDLGAEGKPGHRFFFRPEEVEAL